MLFKAMFGKLQMIGKALMLPLQVVIWPPVQEGLNAFSKKMIHANPTLSAFIFGVVERALIPFGLHHIFYSPFWFEFGEYVNKAEEIVRGDQKIFFAQLKDGVELTAGTFMTWEIPFYDVRFTCCSSSNLS